MAARWLAFTVGLAACVLFGDSLRLSAAQWILLALAAAATLLRPSRLWLLRRLRRWRHPSPRSRTSIAVRVGLGAGIFFVLVALKVGRDLGLAWHDEHSYAIQIRQLMAGRLWGPGHPLHDFFDSHYVLTEGVYASMYFPGTALLHLPGALLGLPFWVTSILISAAAAALIYRIVCELTDGLTGLLAALLFVSVPEVQHMSVMLMSHIPIIVLGGVLLWAWLRWRASGRAGWAGIMGLTAGWMMITRPVDGLAIVLGVLVGLVPDLWERQGMIARRAVAAGVLGMVPFLALQLSVNRHVTGSATTFPHEYYVSRDFPGAEFGFHELHEDVEPRSVVPQKRFFYRVWAAPRIEYHDSSRLWQEWREYRGRTTMKAWAAHPFLFALLPLGVFGLRDRRRLAAVLSIPGFLALYALYCFYPPHYPIVVLLAATTMMALGVREVPRAWRASRGALRVFGLLAALAIAIGAWPFFDDRSVVRELDVSELRRIDETLRRLPHKPAIVLFRWHPRLNPHVEPVYNTDVAWPDDALVIRAHDLGEKNVELIEYYVRTQPQRHLYLLDRGRGRLWYFGSVADVLDGMRRQEASGIAGDGEPGIGAAESSL